MTVASRTMEMPSPDLKEVVNSSELMLSVSQVPLGVFSSLEVILSPVRPWVEKVGGVAVV